MVRICVAQQRLRLLLLAFLDSHRLSGELHCSGDSIERQMQLVELLARVLVAQLDSALAIPVVRDLVERFVQVDDLSCHFNREALDPHDAEDDQDRGCHQDHDENLIEYVLDQQSIE